MPTSSAINHSSGRSSSTPTTAASSCRARTPTTRSPKAARRLRHRRHSRAAARHRREDPRHLPVRSPHPSARDAARPRRLAARARRARRQQSRPSSSVDESSIAGIPGVQIVRRNNFVGVVAEREWDAVRAASQLKVTWQPFATALPGHEGLFDSFRSAKTNDLVDTDAGDVDAALARAAHVVSATYRGPYQSHGAMAPNCAVADVTSDAALVICSSQAIYLTRFGLAPLLGLAARQDPRAVRRGLEHLRQQLLRRGRERGRDPLAGSRQAGAAPAQPRRRARLGQLWPRAALRGACGRRLPTASSSRSTTRRGRTRRHGSKRHRSSRLGTRRRPAATAFPLRGRAAPGCSRSTCRKRTCTTSPNRRIVNHVVTGAGYLRTGALRAPMDPSTFFALEGVLDELAHAAKLDPYELRKRNISDARWLAVLEAAAGAAKWTPRVAASQRSSARVVTGRGIAVGTHHLPQNQGDRVTYAAAVVDIEVNKDTGAVVAKHVYGAMDCGLAINPGIVESQIVGMCVHGDEPRALRGSAVQRDQRHERRLGVVSDAALRRAPERHADSDPTTPRTKQRRRRGSHAGRGRRDRQRVLRRDRREAPAVPADAEPRPSGAWLDGERVRLAALAVAGGLLAERHRHAALRARDDAGDRAVAHRAGEPPRVDVRQREEHGAIRDREVAQRSVDGA